MGKGLSYKARRRWALVILLLGLIITFLLPRLKALWAGIAFWGLLTAMIGSASYMFVGNGLWIQMTYPVLLLIAGYIGVLSIKYFVTETGKEKVEVVVFRGSTEHVLELAPGRMGVNLGAQ